VKTLGVVLLVLVLGAHLAHQRLEANPPPTPPSLEQALPSARALDFIAAGYRSLAADYYFLRALDEFGDNHKQRARYPNLIALVRRVIDLDPKWTTAYYFAGTALTVKELDPGPSLELLERGERERPDDWRIPFLLGFNAFYFAHDYRRGAEALALAARNPKAPPAAGPLATRLAAESNAPEVGLAMIDGILPTVKDEKLRALYRERRTLLELEVDLKYLNQASALFVQANGRPPKDLRELLDVGLLQSLPDEPTGGRFFLRGSEVHTTHDEQRLRLSDAGPERRP
jgi:tetratricopeptide (TPR) repeat protein